MPQVKCAWHIVRREVNVPSDLSPGSDLSLAPQSGKQVDRLSDRQQIRKNIDVARAADRNIDVDECKMMR